MIFIWQKGEPALPRILFFIWLIFQTANPCFAANGYQSTADWWNKAYRNVSQHSLLLQNLYADVEAQMGPDKSQLTQAFAKRLAQQYPGSNYYGSIGTLAINGYTQLTYDNNWEIVAVRQNFGSLQQTLDFRNLTATYTNGPNRVVFKLDTRNLNRAQFTSVEIPAITVTAHNIWMKKKDGKSQPLKDILNDAYAYQIAANEGMSMDKVAEGLVSDESMRQQVLSIADTLYSRGSSRQATSSGASQTGSPLVQSARPASPNFSFELPWFFWPAIVLIGGASVLMGSHRRRRAKSPSSWSPSRRRNYDEFSLGKQQPIEGGFSSQKSGPSPVANPVDLPVDKPKEWDVELLRSLEWKRFETVCAEYYRMTGYEPKETRIGADGGVDIWVYKPGVDKPVGLVQCKAWNTYKVGVKPVRELLGVMAANGIANGKFMTSGDFTSEALAFAADNRLELISGKRIVDAIMKLTPEKRQALLDIAIKGDYRTPTCPQCGVKMTLREGKERSRVFWGCPRFPRCKATLVYKYELD